MAVRHVLGAAVVGAASMFLLDPQQGRHRRVVIRNRIRGGISEIEEAAGVAARDLRNRAQGLIAEARSRLVEEEVPDQVLAARVRSRLGWVVSHPGAIKVTVLQGTVSMSGAVLEREYSRLLRSVWAVRGVRDLEDHLTVYERPDHVSALQGEGKAVGPRQKLFNVRWSPAARAMFGLAGTVLVLHAVFGRSRRTALLSGAAGVALLARSATNTPLDRLVSHQGESVDIQKSIQVAAPVERVFEVFTRQESLPNYMTNVLDVSSLGEGVSRWTVAGPAGQLLSWDAVVSRQESNRLIAWRTLPGSDIQHAGILRFEPGPKGTKITVTLSYLPPVGVLGHALARLLHADPKSELDHDLMRLKVYLETGRRPHDAAAARH